LIKMDMADNDAWPYPRPDSPPILSPVEAEHTLDVWLVPKFSMLTLTCLLEPLRVANRFGRDLFAWRLLSANGEEVVASNGARIDVDASLDSVSDSAHLMVVASYEPEATITSWERAVLRRVAAHGGWLGGVDTAPFILARSGVLERYPVAMHWESIPSFRHEFPQLEVSPARFELDDVRLTGTGGAASIDMMLTWIERAYGPALANAIGLQLIHKRGRDEPVLTHGHRGPHLPRTVVRALTIMEANLSPTLAIPEVCRIVGQSQRQLARLFMTHFGETPKQCYLGMRLDEAHRILADSRCWVTQAAQSTGFTHLAHFSRAYRQRFGESPSVTAERGSQ
jgi:AraC family carnitine catabolism transcriptional activator